MMMTSYAKWMAIGIATILHFLVDGLCVCCLYLTAGPSTALRNLCRGRSLSIRLFFMMFDIIKKWARRYACPQIVFAKRLLVSEPASEVHYEKVAMVAGTNLHEAPGMR